MTTVSSGCSSSAEDTGNATTDNPGHRFWATVPPSAEGGDDLTPRIRASASPSSLPPSSCKSRIRRASVISQNTDISHLSQQLVLRNSHAYAGPNEPLEPLNLSKMLVVPHPHQSGNGRQLDIPSVMGREHQSRILFVSLLESYCRTYDDDPLSNRRLFFAICRTLYSMGIIGKEYVDEMSAIRSTYSDAFRKLVAKAQESLDMYERHDIETGIRSLMSGVTDDSDSFEIEHSETQDWSSSENGSHRSIAGQQIEGLTEESSEFSYAKSCAEDDSYGYADNADNLRTLPIALRAKSRRNTVSNVGKSTASFFTDPFQPSSYKHNDYRDYRKHGHHRQRSQSNAVRHGSFQAASTISRVSNKSSPQETNWLLQTSRASKVSASSTGASTFENMMIDMQRSRYHDDFIQLRCLGKGGFGKVYEVRNKLDGRRYAVKQIKIKGEITAEKTLREIKTLANLDHPNIVRYYSSWIEVTKLRKKGSYNSPGMSISPQSLGSSSHRNTPFGFSSNNRGAAISEQKQTHSLESADEDDDDENSNVASSYKRTNPGRKHCSAGDSALNSIGVAEVSVEDTSGGSLWRTVNSGIPCDDFDCNGDIGEFSNSSSNSSSSDGASFSSESSYQISFINCENNEPDNDKTPVNGSSNQEYSDDNSVAFIDSVSKVDTKYSNYIKPCPSTPCATRIGHNNSDIGDMGIPSTTNSLPHSRIDPIPIDRSGTQQKDVCNINIRASGYKGHRRRKSAHVVASSFFDKGAPSRQSSNDSDNVGRQQPHSANDSYTGLARSFPSQGMPSGRMDFGQSLVAETSLFVQMQLCQTTLQEFLVQRNERIAQRQAEANTHARNKACEQQSELEMSENNDWYYAREHDLLIDPVMNIRLFRAIVEGVKYFHNRGVIHRDLKGANVFLDIMYSDSGGNPISRGGSGIGRPDQQQSSALSFSSSRNSNGIAAALPVRGMVSVHSDIWDAVDGGNLKEKIGADGQGVGSLASATTITGSSAPVFSGAGVGNNGIGNDIFVSEGRKVDWDAVFDSILLHRSIDGTLGSYHCRENLADGISDHGGIHKSVPRTNISPEMPSSPSSIRSPAQLPPVVSFIPRIGDFGLATKSTLGIRASGDEYAFIGNSKGAASKESGSLNMPTAKSASVIVASPEDGENAFNEAQSGGDYARGRRGSIYDPRRTSNVGTITYAAPEQLCDKTTVYNEKADIYSLGIIFFELYYPFATAMERIAVIKDLRRGVFPPQFLQMWPKEAALILQLMDVDPAKRPSAKEVLSFDLIDVPTLESAQLKREVNMLKQQLRLANQRNEELGLRVRELERIVDMSI
ncbi:hypothetical protein GGI26_003828 [Coemansia sp. RSA 1358]|nr:hypothetical protein GGI26_003828 [Coemansia sp. RSA 1358]